MDNVLHVGLGMANCFVETGASIDRSLNVFTSCLWNKIKSYNNRELINNTNTVINIELKIFRIKIFSWGTLEN